MAGAFPGAELVAVAAVFVVHDGVDVIDFFHAGFDEAANGGGALHSAEVVALDFLLCGVDRGAVIGKVLHEDVGQIVGDELGGDTCFGELHEVGVGSGQERRLAGTGGSGEVIGKAGLVLRNRSRGASDILHVETEGIGFDPFVYDHFGSFNSFSVALVIGHAAGKLFRAYS